MNGATITAILDLGNLILASVNVIISFSLFVYILTHNFRSPVARAFCALRQIVQAFIRSHTNSFKKESQNLFPQVK